MVLGVVLVVQVVVTVIASALVLVGVKNFMKCPRAGVGE